MTDPTPLSPAAQAVLDATTDVGLGPFVSRAASAAALRAAADQVAVPNQPTVTVWETGFCAGTSSAQQALRVIAAELEGAGD